MPPSPALRCSPGRELRGNNHKRGHSFEGGLLFREKDDDLALFSEMQTRERENFLLQSSDDLEATFSSKLRHFSDIKLGISIPVRGESTSDLLNVDGEKNDYDWLLTPPDTPLFPSLDDEPPQLASARRGRPRSQPISISRSSTMEKSYRSSRGSASPNRLSPSPRSGSSTFQSRGRPSSAGQSSPSPSIRPATPSRRPSTPPSKPSTPVPRSSTPTPRRMSTGSGSGASSGTRGISPVKTSRGNSASPKIRAWQTNIPGFSSDAPPNLRTSLADRPATYVRGSSPATRSGRDSSSKFRRQSMSPTASRSVSSSHSHERDPFSSQSKGSIASSGDDDVDSIQSMHVGSLDRSTTRRVATFSNNRAPTLSKKSAKIASPSSAPKRSFDSALRQMDHRKSPQNMFRPLLSSVPSTTFYVGKASSAHRSLISRNSSVTTSSNASSDQGTSAAPDTEGSDHNQEDVANEYERVPFSDVPEEVFAFDKMDIVNEAIGHEIHNGSIDINNDDFNRSPKTEFVPAEPGESCHHGIDAEVGPTSEASFVNDDFSEVDSLEIMAVCSRCGCRYHASEEEERVTRLCPECTMKDKLLRITALETAVVVSTSVVSSTNTSEEEKPSDDFASEIAVPELQQVTEVCERKSSQDEEIVEEGKISYNQQSHNYLQENSVSRSELEGGKDSFTKQQEEEDLLAVGQGLHSNDTGGKNLRHSTDYSNLKFEVSEGAGISVLLKRTSSSKGPVVQGRNFSASSIPYDALSYAKDSASSMRSSIGHGSFSTSSSVDFGTRPTDSRVQRQLSSGRKSDTEHYSKNTKHQTVGSSFCGTADLSHQALSLSTNTHEDNSHVSTGNMEYDVLRETLVTSHDHLLASECTEADVSDTPSMRTFFVEKDDYEHHNSNITVDASTSQTNYEACVSHVELPKGTSSVTELELDMIPGSSCKEEGTILNVDKIDTEVATHGSVVTLSEIETESRHHSTPGSASDSVSLASKSTSDEPLEPSPFNPCDKDMITSATDSMISDQAHDILEQESTIMVECQRGSKARSLTLEEATDTILFCSSIVHELAYQAATIALEKESSDSLEGSQPTVTILGKSNSDNKKDLPRGRTVSNRPSKSQKARKRRVEKDAKPPSITENDENAVEPLKRSVEPPNKLDTMKPPKLESKCNCTIM
ncbi:RUN/FYVE domain protein [Trema orientale]|uniref:RUN/FYVE domain protein n=1 Tax=Trema orientale TaxID=63057 RepID=A0A2P5EBA3_TREOI|nr:RUN/FYVE domain protein [Trema orientale]